MPRIKYVGIGQGHQATVDGCHQGIEIPSRQIGSADTSLKEHITTQDPLLLLIDKNQATRRMSGCLAHLEDQFTELNDITLRQVAFGEGEAVA